MREQQFLIPGTLDQLDGLNDRITRFLQSHDRNLPESWLEEIRLIATEIFVNICRYAELAADKDVKVCVQQDPDRIKLWFLDKGVRWNPVEAPDPVLDEPQKSGYGLFLVRKLSEQFEYSRQESSDFPNRLLIVKSLPNA